MSQIIASTYEIETRIGSGGGGIVYLANHLRLGKKVVLKADKRKLSTHPEVLRREVDALKNLSHTYIPQVYDFFVEDETVYTVMDFIEGESLDKLLKRGTHIQQATVIKWACELLEALAYLHSPTHGNPPHGFVHSDIKPSNLMLTPFGDIRLIDFNIALSLGEEGVVGRSDGYASPEHHGLDFSFDSITQTDAIGEASTQDDATEILPKLSTPVSTGSSRKRLVAPDARSDIYSVGATLYHLLSGKKPATHALDVTPLSEQQYTPQVVKIISRAMNPNPDLRFQSAEEMLDAFIYLRENDPRTLRYRRIRNISTLMCVFFFLLGTITAFTGLRRMQSEQEILAIQESNRAQTEEKRAKEEQERAQTERERAQAERERAEAERIRADEESLKKEIEQAKNYSNESEKALANGEKQNAILLALKALPGETSSYLLSDIPEAMLALSNALGIYDLSDGFKAHQSIILDSEAIKFALSPDGTTAVALSLGTLTVFKTEDAEIIDTLPMVESALADAIFLSNDILIYAGEDGISSYRISNRTIIWVGYPATTVAASTDGRTIAAVYRDDEMAYVYTAEGEMKLEIPFDGKRLHVVTNDRLGDPKDNLFALNADGSLLAVSFSDGSLCIFDLRNNNNDIELLDPSDYTHFEGGFFEQYFAFSSTSSSESLFAVIDTLELVETISTVLPARIGVTADDSGIYMSYNGTHVVIDPLTALQTPIDFDPTDIIAGKFKLIGNLNSPVLYIRKYEEHNNTEIFGYDADYFHDESRLSGDGKTVMLFSIDGFRLYGIDGTLIKEFTFPESGNIYDQQYLRINEASYLEVTYYDGTIRTYSAVDGVLIVETKGESPDESLYEEFVTDEIMITSPMHGTPVAYDIKTGATIRELERDAYLTYVTRSGDYIITEYISLIDGLRYGLLLDGRTCETLAYLPSLCDVIGDRLIFDIRTGSLRETHIHTIAELIDLAAIATTP